VIGILGGYGAVGAHAARWLRQWTDMPLRIGARHQATAEYFVSNELKGRGEAVETDVTHDTALSKFVRDCTVVLNCAGPSHQLAKRTARAAVNAGANYVDAGGEEELVDALQRTTRLANRSAVFFAGALPGLSGLLPRWLALREFDRVHSLIVYHGILDRFTESAAEDYLQGILGGSTKAFFSWRDGQWQPHAGTSHERIRLPFFPGDVSVTAYADAEGAHLVSDLSLKAAQFNNVHDGVHLPAVLEHVRGLDRRQAIAAVCRASALDVSGRTPYANFLAQLTGTKNGREISRTAVLLSTGVGAATGTVAALATLASLHDKIPPGAHHAAGALDPTTVDQLEKLPGVCEITVLEGTVDDLETVETGTL
jgi:hypothetical protein